jgi:hypothetical protein
LTRPTSRRPRRCWRREGRREGNLCDRSPKTLSASSQQGLLPRVADLLIPDPTQKCGFVAFATKAAHRRFVHSCSAPGLFLSCYLLDRSRDVWVLI